MTKKTLFYIMLLMVAACKQAYEPPAIKANNNYLVVDGFINATPNSKTTITVSRTRNLVDTVLTTLPEPNAQVSIEAQTGAVYNLSAVADGVYTSAGSLPVTTSGQYRINITTQDGSKYQSDFVAATETPPIDSLTWQQDGNVTISVNSHDPKNLSRYYRWDYVETWEYHSPLRGSIAVKDGLIYYIDSTNRIDVCWRDATSSSIVIDNTLRLSEDKVDHFPVAIVPQNSDKIEHRYSILVSQYTLTEDAYNYWEILQKNTQQAGSLFDPQPSQLKGNFHCLTNPTEPVIGFASAASVQTKRIFILNSEVTNWLVPPYDYDCQTKTIDQNPIDFRIYDYPDPRYTAYYFSGSTGLVIAPKICMDCILTGGTNKRPSFW